MRCNDVALTSVRRHFDVMCPLGIGRLRKRGGQRSVLISLVLNNCYETLPSIILLPVRNHERKFRFFI